MIARIYSTGKRESEKVTRGENIRIDSTAIKFEVERRCGNRQEDKRRVEAFEGGRMVSGGWGRWWLPLCALATGNSGSSGPVVGM